MELLTQTHELLRLGNSQSPTLIAVKRGDSANQTFKGCSVTQDSFGNYQVLPPESAVPIQQRMVSEYEVDLEKYVLITHQEGDIEHTFVHRKPGEKQNVSIGIERCAFSLRRPSEYARPVEYDLFLGKWVFKQERN